MSASHEERSHAHGVVLSWEEEEKRGTEPVEVLKEMLTSCFTKQVLKNFQVLWLSRAPQAGLISIGASDLHVGSLAGRGRFGGPFFCVFSSFFFVGGGAHKQSFCEKVICEGGLKAGHLTHAQSTRLSAGLPECPTWIFGRPVQVPNIRCSVQVP